MSPIETRDILSEDEDGTGDNYNVRLVPVAESIRYRKRAQSAEKKVEALMEELAQAKSKTAEMSEQLNITQLEQKLTQKLFAAGATDLEAAVLIAKTKLQGDGQADLNSVVGQLKKEKQYLFAGPAEAVISKKTAGARERTTYSQTALERAAKRAARTGNRTDLQEYLKLRRNFL